MCVVITSGKSSNQDAYNRLGSYKHPSFGCIELDSYIYMMMGVIAALYTRLFQVTREVLIHIFPPLESNQ